jgi:hypothetical protein
MSNIGWNNGYPDCFPWISSVLSRENAYIVPLVSFKCLNLLRDNSVTI